MNKLTCYIKLMGEWDWDKNNFLGLNPKKLTGGSNKRAGWKCKACSKTWMVSVSHRTIDKTGCPYCASKIPTLLENLSVAYPDIVLEWSDKNLKHPSEFRPMSNKKVWWKCSKCGEEWQAGIANRTTRKTGCPYCCNPPLYASRNRNLGVLFPDVARQLHPVKNGDLVAVNILPFSNKKLWFVCENGHEYEMILAARTKQGQGCPKCHKSVSRIQLRVFSEVVRFYPDAELESKRLGVEVDILIPSIKMGIEVDGWRWHRDKDVVDKRKNAIVKSMGYGLIRLREQPLKRLGILDIVYSENPKDEEILNAVVFVFEIISKHTKEKNNYGRPEGFYEEYRYRELVAVRGKMPTNKTLQYCYPEVAKLWSDKNELSPLEVRHGEHKDAWWRCDKGHEFKAWVGNMITAFKRGASSMGCPYCAGRYASKTENLAIVAPQLVKQWHPTLNGDLTPSNIRPMSNRKVWWRCDKGHEWLAVIGSRTRGCGCPVCYGRKNSGF